MRTHATACVRITSAAAVGLYPTGQSRKGRRKRTSGGPPHHPPALKTSAAPRAAREPTPARRARRAAERPGGWHLGGRAPRRAVPGRTRAAKSRPAPARAARGGATAFGGNRSSPAGKRDGLTVPWVPIRRVIVCEVFVCSLPRPFFPLFLFVSTSVQRVSVYCRMAVHAECYEVHRMSCASHGTWIQVVYLDVLCAVAERAAVAVSAVDLASDIVRD